MSMSRSAQGLRRVQFVHERTPGRSQPFTWIVCIGQLAHLLDRALKAKDVRVVLDRQAPCPLIRASRGLEAALDRPNRERVLHRGKRVAALRVCTGMHACFPGVGDTPDPRKQAECA